MEPRRKAPLIPIGQADHQRRAPAERGDSHFGRKERGAADPCRHPAGGGSGEGGQHPSSSRHHRHHGAARAHGRQPGRGRAHEHRGGLQHHPRVLRSLRARQDHARLHSRARPDAVALRPRHGLASRRLRHRFAPGGSAHRGTGQDGRRDRDRRGLHPRSGEATEGRSPRARPGHGDRDRESDDGGNPRRGHHDHRERRPRAGGGRSGDLSERDGSEHLRRRHRHHHHRRRPVPERRELRRPSGSNRERHLPGGGSPDRRECQAQGRPSRHDGRGASEAPRGRGRR